MSAVVVPIRSRWRKPLLRRCDGMWLCEWPDAIGRGFGETPREAYADSVRRAGQVDLMRRVARLRALNRLQALNDPPREVTYER